MIDFNEQFCAALRKEYAAEATDEQFALWVNKCKTEELVPVEDVVMQIRETKEWDPAVRAKVARKKIIFITTVRALTKIASRSGKYLGKLQAEWIYNDANGNPTIISTVPLADPTNPRVPLEPWGARVGVRHADFPDPVLEFARFHAYAQTRKDADGNVYLTSMWASRGPEQIAKCAFAASLRAAFPEAGNLYLSEELDRLDNDVPEPEKPTVTATVAIPTTVHVPKVDHTPVAATVKAAEPEDPTYELRTPEPAQTPEEGAAFIAKLTTSMDEAEAAEEKAAPPTKEQATAFKSRLVAFDVDRQALKAFVLRTAGTDNIKNLTVAQWEKVLELLDAAAAGGPEALANLAAGGGN